jgi:hypothetical protein
MDLQEMLTKMIPGILDERLLNLGCQRGAILPTETDKLGPGAILKEDGVSWAKVESLNLEFSSEWIDRI